MERGRREAGSREAGRRRKGKRTDECRRVGGRKRGKDCSRGDEEKERNR